MSAVTLPPPPAERVMLPLPSEIDVRNADGLLPLIMYQARSGSAGPAQVMVLDLSATRFMDSQGVRLINDARRLLLPDTRVLLVALPESMACRVLEVTGLRRDVPVYDNLPEAMAA
ncbi:STAS domain-containing protein [Streptomyces sp. NPDC096105]|uniref:STAS domain-containing protein n=2 Tax=unclassified Streptomyces TaxID=2593676 RepID=UPI00381991DB